MPDLALFEERPVDAIVGREPSWIVNSGISLVFVVVTVLFVITWFIRYPDSIYSQITLTTAQPPTQLVSNINGRITRLFVKEGEQVTRGTPLVLLENSVDYDKLLRLKQQIAQLKSADSQLPEALAIDGLGELQAPVNQLNRILSERHLLQNSKQLANRIEATEQLSQQYQQLQVQLTAKQKTMQAKLKLESDLLTKNRGLKTRGLTTDAKLAVIENRYLDKKLALEDINIQKALYNIKLKEIDQQLAEFKIMRIEQQLQLTTALMNAKSALASQIDQWQQKYLLTSPSEGVVAFSNYWSVNQHVKSGDVVVNVVNADSTKMGKMELNQQGAGKVKIGQRVYIELVSFPAHEYGRLEGKVQAISLVPGQNGYLVDVELPQDLTTTYGRKLPFSPNLLGTAKVITQDRRLLERFLDKIIYAFDQT
ncbi:MAG: HlyD family secretion protein [Psychrosphaera sp.]|nr:HlyD family secretion protein [Psychrosphaera sp.]